MARVLIVVGAGLALALAACAEPAPQALAVASVTDAIPAAVWPAEPSLVTEVSCPDLVELPIAQSFVCEARLHGDTVTIDVDVDELAKTTAAVREPLFDLRAAADQIRDRLIVDLDLAPDSFAVICERSVVVAMAGTSVVCVGERAGDPLDFVVELEDDAGAWSLSFEPG